MKFFLLFLFLFPFSTGFTQTDSLYQAHEWIRGNDTLRYRLLLPKDYDSSRNYPLILFLHGAGERGSDNKAQLIHGSSLFARADVQANHPAIVVFPQCPANDFWSNVRITIDTVAKKRSFEFQENGEPTPVMRRLLQWFPEFMDQMPVNRAQVYVMGLSMGGMGTFEIVRRMPNVFAAAIPICGGANPATAKQIRRVPFWVIHGAADEVVPASLSEGMVMALQQYYDAADMQFTLYPGVKHNSWDKAFAEKDLLPWLFANQLKAPNPPH
jgi:predicted peptidase